MSQTKDKVQELLDILKDSKDEKLQYQDDVLQFLDFYNIKSGRQYIRATTIKKLYYLWSHTPIDSNILGMRLNDYLNPLSKRNIQYYKINQKVLNLTKAAYEALAQEKKRVSVIDHQKVDEFIKDYRLEKGTHYCDAIALQELFLSWMEKKGYKSRVFKNRKKFFFILELYFDKRITDKDVIYFGINRNLKTAYEELKKADTKI